MEYKPMWVMSKNWQNKNRQISGKTDKEGKKAQLGMEKSVMNNLMSVNLKS